LVIVAVVSTVAAFAINAARRGEKAARGRADRALVAERSAKAEAQANLVKAEANYAMARDAVDRFYTRVSEDKLLNEPHMDRLRKELLGLARDFYQKFADERRTDPRARLDLGNAYIRLAHIGHTIGSETEGVGHAEKARAMFTALTAEHPGIAAYRY